MQARQGEECQRNNNFNNVDTRFTPLNNDHVHFQHRNIADNSSISNMVPNNGMIYGSPRNGEDELPPPPPPPNAPRSDIYSSNHSFDSEASSTSSRNEGAKTKLHKKSSWEPSCLQKKNPSSNNNYEGHQSYSPSLPSREPQVLHNQTNTPTENQIGFSTLDYGERLKPQPWPRAMEINNASMEFQHATRRILRNDGKYLDLIKIKWYLFLSCVEKSAKSFPFYLESKIYFCWISKCFRTLRRSFGFKW